MKKAIITFAAIAICVATAYAQEIHVDNMQIDLENNLLQDGKGFKYTFEQEFSMQYLNSVKQHMGSAETSRKSNLAESIASYADVALSKNKNALKVDIPVLSEAGASEQSFGIEGDPTGYLAVEGDDVVFNKGTKKYEGDGDTRSLPRKRKAARIAKKHLAKLGILKRAIRRELKLAHVGGVNKAVYNSEDGTVQDYRKFVTVYYDRYIKEMPVIGHSRVVVTLGEDGELTGLIKKWTNAPKDLKLAASDFLPERRVRKQVKDILNRLYKKSKDNDIDSINVTDAKYILYDDGTTIEPALLTLGAIMLNDGTSDNGDWIIPVLKNPKANYKVLALR